MFGAQEDHIAAQKDQVDKKGLKEKLDLFGSLVKKTRSDCPLCTL